MNHRLSITYALKWQLKYAPQYKFTADGICVNCQTGRIIRKVVNGRCVGYCINGKFKSAIFLRTQLEKIPDIEIPF
jgi:hypothetical protein